MLRISFGLKLLGDNGLFDYGEKATATMCLESLTATGVYDCYKSFYELTSYSSGVYSVKTVGYTDRDLIDEISGEVTQTIDLVDGYALNSGTIFFSETRGFEVCDAIFESNQS